MYDYEYCTNLQEDCKEDLADVGHIMLMQTIYTFIFYTSYVVNQEEESTGTGRFGDPWNAYGERFVFV